MENETTRRRDNQIDRYGNSSVRRERQSERRPSENRYPYRSDAARRTEPPYRASGRLPAEAHPARTEVSYARAPRKRSKNRRSPLPILLFIVGLAVLAAIVIALMALFFGRDESAHDDAQDGIAFLEAQEAKDPAAIDEALATIRKKRIEIERDIILDNLIDDENDAWSMFHDYVILGDSRAVGFYYYDFLDKNRVLAEGGDTIRKIAEHMDEIKALKPSYIFLCYGLNDVSIGYWSSPEEYSEEFMQICTDLKEAVPNVKIIVSSILPARDPAFDVSSLWREIPTYSDVLQEACEENDILFVDNSQTAEDHADLWDIDGIHVKRDFYKYWARNLIVAVIEDESYE